MEKSNTLYANVGRRFGMKMLVLLLFFPIFCIASELFQASTFSALSDGVYDGDFTYQELMKRGNFGLGTFNGTDGEMIALDGQFYQTTYQGKVKPVSPKQKTPFAAVVFFRSAFSAETKNVKTLQTLCKFLEGFIQQKNTPHAICITGKFRHISLRNLHEQKPPYRPLSETSKEQHLFEAQSITGTLVGFYFPKYLDGINVNRCHFHFIDAKKETGGHVLDVAIDSAKCEFQPCDTFTISLPQTKEFSQANLMVGQ